MDLYGPAEMKDDEGQNVNWPLNDQNYLSQLFNIHLVKKEILKYLDGTALINLSSVNMKIREEVTSSPQYQKVMFRVNTNSINFLTNMPSPPWTAHLTHLTLVIDTELVLICQEKFLSFARILPNLSSLVIVNDSKSYDYAGPFLDKILNNLSSNLKSLSLPYDLHLVPITFDNNFENLKHLKLTTSTNRFSFDEQNEILDQNLRILASKCVKCASLTFEELVQVDGQFVNEYDEGGHDSFAEILSIIENNTESLEKLEFGICQLLADPVFSLYLSDISMPNLTFLNLRAVEPEIVYHILGQYRPSEPPILRILNNLPQPGKLTTLQLTLTKCPLELFDLIPQKFSQLKSLSLKGTKYDSNSSQEINENRWIFLQSLTQLEELEITRLKNSYYPSDSADFALKVSNTFPVEYLQINNLRKLSLKGIGGNLAGFTYINEIGKMGKLKELAITGWPLYLDDFLTICRNLKFLEKLEISHLHVDKFNPQSTTSTTAAGGKIDNREYSTLFSSLKYLRELSIAVLSGDFRQVFGPISFPYLKTLIFCSENLGKKEVEKIIELNGMLKELYIVNLKTAVAESNEKSDEDFGIVNKRQNLKIDFSTKH